MKIAIKRGESLDINTRKRIEYFDKYCPIEKLGEYFEKYELYSVRGYSTTGERFDSNEHFQMYAFKIGDNCYKITTNFMNRHNQYAWIGYDNKPEAYQNVWGISQLPEKCNTILITEGLKDAFVANVNLNHLGIYAVGVDNAHTSIPTEIVETLRAKCDNLVLCYDIDSQGKKAAIKAATQHNLKICILSEELLNESEGKDISDWLGSKLDISELLRCINNPISLEEVKIEETTVSLENSAAQELWDIEQEIIKYANKGKKPIPILAYNNNPIIFKGTINAIVGNEGSHKSHFAENIASILLSDEEAVHKNSPFHRVGSEKFHVLYLDSERNIEYELAESRRSVLNRVDLDIDYPDFSLSSLKNIPRSERLKVMKAFLNEKRGRTSNHLVVILDVSTDMINNFNDIGEANDFFDSLSRMAEKEDVTFLCVIHVNPGTSKARGHIGTELGNKTSTRINLYNYGSHIRLNFSKLRYSEPIPNAYLKYNKAEGWLQELEDFELKQLKSSKKVSVDDLSNALFENLSELNKEYPQKEVLDHMKEKFDCSLNTIKSAIDEILTAQKGIIEDDKGRKALLNVNSSNGKKTFYSISPLTD